MLCIAPDRSTALQPFVTWMGYLSMKRDYRHGARHSKIEKMKGEEGWK